MARHWKAVHHQEGFVPRQEHTHCVEAFDDAVAFLQEALRQAAEQYRVRDADGSPGALYVSDGFVRHPHSWAEAHDAATEGIGRIEEHFADLSSSDPESWAAFDGGSCIEVLGINYVIEGCDREVCQVRPAWVTLYHRTTPERAAQIRAERAFVSRERPAFVYFTDRAEGGYADGYGSAVVAVTVPAGMALPEDEFGDGERHFRVEASKIRPEWVRMTVPGGA